MNRNIFESINCKSHDLNMTVDGFEETCCAMKKLDEKMPQVYIHVGNQGAIKNQVLRVGKGESGAYKRWMVDTNGHKNTFFWSIGETDKYRKSAEKYPHYLLFFASLYELSTKLHVLTFKTIDEAKSKEKIIEKHYSPIWKKYLWYETYPRSAGIYKDKIINETASKYGGALDAINIQRMAGKSFMKQFPDVINMNLNSGKKW